MRSACPPAAPPPSRRWGRKAAVVLGYFFHDQSTLDYQLDPGETERRLQSIAGSSYPRVRRTGQRAHEPPFIKAQAPQTNLQMFSDVAASSGYFTLQSDRDGVLRWMPLVIQGGGTCSRRWACCVPGTISAGLS